MTNSVDLTNLRSMTDGDKDLELVLFQEFYTSTETIIQTMSENCTNGNNETWRASAHSLKGMAYNLGAHPLGDLCKKAQDSPDASDKDKEALLNLIKDEYVKVKIFLEGVYP